MPSKKPKKQNEQDRVIEVLTLKVAELEKKVLELQNRPSEQPSLLSTPLPL